MFSAFYVMSLITDNHYLYLLLIFFFQTNSTFIPHIRNVKSKYSIDIFTCLICCALYLLNTFIHLKNRGT